MTFKETVRQIERSEKNVDRVLRAARLQRHPMSNERLEMILGYTTLIIGMILFFGFFTILFTVAR